MSRLTRRDFLKMGAASAGALTLGELLAGCGQGVPPARSPAEASALPAAGTVPTNSPPPASATPVSSAATEAPVPTATSAPSATPLSLPDLAVAHGGEPEAMVRLALSAFGGMEHFVPKGASVIIKPNICTALPYQYAATTNPWVVGTLVKMCYEVGASKVRVMDYPFGSSAQDGYRSSGIRAQVEAAGGEMAYMTPLFKYVRTPIPQGVDLKAVEVFDDVLKADVLINCPIAKDHGSTRLTLGMKNLMGVILDRDTMHVNLGQRIADLASLVRPQLNVVDAVRILVANGPTGGGDLSNVRKTDTVIVSPDIVAADSYATGLFGLQPDDIGYIRAGAAMGLGRKDLQGLKIQDIPV